MSEQPKKWFPQYGGQFAMGRVVDIHVAHNRISLRLEHHYGERVVESVAVEGSVQTFRDLSGEIEKACMAAELLQPTGITLGQIRALLDRVMMLRDSLIAIANAPDATAQTKALLRTIDAELSATQRELQALESKSDGWTP